MQKTHLLAAAMGAAIFALAACGEPEVVTVNRYDPMADALKNAGPVEPPPMIQASRAYRCGDNSLVFIDFMSNGTANVRNQRGGDVVATVTAPNGTPPYVAEGYSVSADAEQISYSAPGRGTQSCHT